MREVFTGGKSPELPTPPWPEDPWSYAVAAKGTLIFTCGQLGKDRKTGKPVPGGLEAQTKQAIENLRNVLREAGADLKDVLKVTVYLADSESGDAFNRVYAQYFREQCPARTRVHSGPLKKEWLVMLDAVAVRPE
jgi:2-iminobutanoate/2-iminopropanoate deaminase